MLTTEEKIANAEARKSRRACRNLKALLGLEIKFQAYRRHYYGFDFEDALWLRDHFLLVCVGNFKVEG